jgi:hypothetical protein
MQLKFRGYLCGFGEAVQILGTRGDSRVQSSAKRGYCRMSH